MKFLGFVEKNRGVIAAGITILCVMVISAALYVLGVSDIANTNSPLKSYTIGNITSFDDEVSVTQGQTLLQSYVSEDLSYDKLGFVANASSESDNLTVEITSGAESQVIKLSGSDLNTSGYTYLELDEKLKSTQQTNLKIAFAVDSGKFTFSANKSFNVDGSICTLANDIQDTNVVIDLRTERSKTEVGLYIFLTIAILIFLVIMVVILKIGHFSIAAVTAVVMAFFCLVCLLIFPPYTVPDENIHYRSAYHISNMQMLNFDDEQYGLYMRECDKDYLENSKISLTQQEYIKEKNYNSLFAENKEEINTGYDYIDNKAVAYFAAGTGITVARIIGLGPYLTFQFARLFNAAMFILMVYFAIKIMPFGKGALSAISLIPITLHITSSCSYDNFTYGGVMLMFAYIMHLMYADNKITWKQLLILALMIVLVVPQKVVYIGVAAILLIIPKERFAKPKLHFVFKCCLGLVAVISILAVQLSSAINALSETATHSGAAGYSLGYILENPIEIIKMLCKTFFVQTDFYVKSLISYFGWFELETPWFTAIPYVVVLCFAFMRRKGEPEPIGFAQRIYALALFCIVCLLIEVVLLLDHTTQGSAIVLGVQGRYFMPALPLLLLFVRNRTVEVKQNFDNYMIFALSSLNGCMFIYCLYRIMVA